MLEGEHVALRGLEVEDAAEILRHFNDMEVRRFLTSSLPVSKEEEERWIRSTWERRRSGTDYVFSIEYKKTRKLIGTCGLHRVNSIHRSAELGIAIWNKQYWGQGLGTEALHLLLEYGFNILNLHRIYLTVLDFNVRAQRAYEKVGFRRVGRHRQAMFRDGAYHDLLIYDLLEEEYRKLRKAGGTASLQASKRNSGKTAK